MCVIYGDGMEIETYFFKHIFSKWYEWVVCIEKLMARVGTVCKNCMCILCAYLHP